MHIAIMPLYPYNMYALQYRLMRCPWIFGSIKNWKLRCIKIVFILPFFFIIKRVKGQEFCRNKFHVSNVDVKSNM